jgi:hypothetical protein
MLVCSLIYPDVMEKWFKCCNKKCASDNFRNLIFVCSISKYDYFSPTFFYTEEVFLITSLRLRNQRSISPSSFCPSVYTSVLKFIESSKYLILRYQVYWNVLSSRRRGTCFSCDIILIFPFYQFNGDGDQTHSSSMRECSGSLSTALQDITGSDDLLNSLWM